MVQDETSSATAPLFSVIIGTYNDWAPLAGCLQSLAQQSNSPRFEVIVVDDGSRDCAPESIRHWASCYPLNVVTQSHAGVSAARNRGIQLSRGSILVFVDADCKFQTDCLSALGSAIDHFPRQHYFQLHLVGDCSTRVGRAEELRLTALQNHMLQPDGRIRYLNTAGFAMRRAGVDIERGVFDPLALRAEDTLLLADLMQRGELPLFVSPAIVQHAISLSLLQCLRKDVRSAYLEARTYDIIAARGARIRVSHFDRLKMLWSMWIISGQPSIGRSVWFVVVGRQVLRLMIHAVRPKYTEPAKS